MKIYKNIFANITSPDNLFSAWDAFKKDKLQKPDVRLFEWNLEKNIFKLHRELVNKTYRHGHYTSFYIRDPKPRHIHKAIVRDRVLHHAVFSIISPIFEPTFIPASFSCRVGFGTHKGIKVMGKMTREVSKNNFAPCYILKCDIKKFFATVNHNILLRIINKRIKDNNAMWLLKEIIESFISPQSTLFERRGLPIGNLTSQIFANIYMNEFDQFIKHQLGIKYYVRYTDDFAIVANNKSQLYEFIPRITAFLRSNLLLELHPQKISIHKLNQGVDFLGYVVFPHHRLLRTKTKRRIFKKIQNGVSEQSLQSYLGVLSHANSHKLSEQLMNEFCLY